MALQLTGGTTTAPNRAPAAKVLAGALSNERVAQSLITALGAFTTPAAIVAVHTSATTDFGALKVGDLVLHLPATAGNSSFGTVVTAGTLPNDGGTAVIGDLYLVMRAVNLDSNNTIPYTTLNGNMTGNGGTEF
jgi:hypothetical protein